MKDELLDKLRAQLDAGITTEPEVLFVLIKIRKLLETRTTGPKSPTLKFFCDWALHTSLDRGGALNIIMQFDKVMEPYLAGDMDAFNASIEKHINDLLTAERFRNELQRFLSFHGLPYRLTSEQSSWQDFVDKYLSSVADSPLEIKPLPVKYVQSVTITNIMETEGKLSWAVKLFDFPNPIYFPFHFLAEGRPEPLQHSAPQTPTRPPG
jgi:hypothetical protein